MGNSKHYESVVCEWLAAWYRVLVLVAPVIHSIIIYVFLMVLPVPANWQQLWVHPGPASISLTTWKLTTTSSAGRLSHAAISASLVDWMYAGMCFLRQFRKLSFNWLLPMAISCKLYQTAGGKENAARKMFLKRMAEVHTRHKVWNITA